jgi:hypothetical protein
VGSAPPDDVQDDWTHYAPLTPPANAGICSFCGYRQTSDRLVVMAPDGAAGICEVCASSHTRFFARRRGDLR